MEKIYLNRTHVRKLYLLLVIIMILILIRCSLIKEYDQKNIKQLSAENYNYKEFIKKEYRIKVTEVIYDDPKCGTRAEAADIIGEVEELGTIRILTLCTSIKNLKENDTFSFLPISKPRFQVSSVYYLIEDLTESEIQKILKTPTTFVTLVSD